MVCRTRVFGVSGDTVLELTKVPTNGRELKEYLKAVNGVSIYRQRLFLSDRPLEDDEPLEPLSEALEPPLASEPGAGGGAGAGS
eukprot:Skav205473  [mRNA]  locus=scaffold830:61390:63759:+ [translate_table: standard]